MTSISSAREKRIMRDKANILNEKQCKTLRNDYRDYINGKISQIKHPKTRATIKEAAKVKYLYNKCVEKYEIGTSIKSSSMSKLTKMMSKKPKTSTTHAVKASSRSASSSSKSKDFLSYENDINIEGDADISDILDMPIETFKNNRLLVKKLIKTPISEKKGLEILRAHLNDPNNHADYVISYREYVIEIKKYLPIYDPFMKKKDLKIYILDYFNPNVQFSRDRMIYFIEYCQKVYTSAIFQDTRNMNMGHFIYDDNYRAVSTPSGFLARLSQSRYSYYALYFINKILLNEINGDPELIRNFILTKKLLKNLIDKDFVIEDTDVSLSFSTSSSSSKSDDMTKKDSSMNNIYRELGRREFVKYIMNNGDNPRTVNDADPYLGVKWERMSVNKLRMVVKIPTEMNGRVFTYAFYSRSLYKDWKNAMRTKKPFINPFTRTPFGEDDEAKILNVLEQKYPYITMPPQEHVNRFDLYFQEPETIRVNGLYFWQINIWYNYGTRQIPEYIKIVAVNIISSLDLYNDDREVEYHPIVLFENIGKLKRENKIIGKKMPFKLHPAFAKYFNTYITTEAQYKDFFTLLNR
jgi:hypothetical protein